MEPNKQEQLHQTLQLFENLWSTFFQSDGAQGKFQPVSGAIDENEATITQKDQVDGASGAAEQKKKDEEEAKKALHSESVLYVGYYSAHEQTVDEEASKREKLVRRALLTTLESTTIRYFVIDDKSIMLPRSLHNLFFSRSKREFLWDFVIVDGRSSSAQDAAPVPTERLRSLMALLLVRDMPDIGRSFARAAEALVLSPAAAAASGGRSRDAAAAAAAAILAGPREQFSDEMAMDAWRAMARKVAEKMTPRRCRVKQKHFVLLWECVTSILLFFFLRSLS